MSSRSGSRCAPKALAVVLVAGLLQAACDSSHEDQLVPSEVPPAAVAALFSRIADGGGSVAFVFLREASGDGSECFLPEEDCVRLPPAIPRVPEEWVSLAEASGFDIISGSTPVTQVDDALVIYEVRRVQEMGYLFRTASISPGGGSWYWYYVVCEDGQCRVANESGLEVRDYHVAIPSITVGQLAASGDLYSSQSDLDFALAQPEVYLIGTPASARNDESEIARWLVQGDDGAEQSHSLRARILAMDARQYLFLETAPITTRLDSDEWTIASIWTLSGDPSEPAVVFPCDDWPDPTLELFSLERLRGTVDVAWRIDRNSLELDFIYPADNNCWRTMDGTLQP